MQSEPRSKISARNQSVTRAIARALCDAGIDAVDALDFLDGIHFVGGTVEDVAQGRTLVAWDVDFIDPKDFPMKDCRGVLVTRILDEMPLETLVQRLVRLMRTLKDEGTPNTVLVLEPAMAEPPGKFFSRKSKAAA